MMRWTQEMESFLKDTATMQSGLAYRLFVETFGNGVSYKGFCTKKSLTGNCLCEEKGLVWKKVHEEFIKTTEGQDRKQAFQEFREKFPDMNVTWTAFHNKRCRLGAAEKRPHNSNPRQPLYAESRSKKYRMIKVAMPNVWISKARWVYEETHPGELTNDGDNFFFLNGNREDYSPDNIIKVAARERTLFIQAGGVTDNPEITRMNVLKARLKLAQLDFGEKCGLVVLRGKSRVFKTKGDGK